MGMKREGGVSEVIGTLLLVGVVVIGIAVTGTLLLSQPNPAKIPTFRVIISNQSENIYLKHKGGDPLNAGEYQILVDGVDRTSSFTNSGDDPWSIGERLSYTAPSIPKRVVIVLNQSGGGSYILASGDFTPSISVPEPQSDWYSNSATDRCEWSYRKAITLDHTMVAGSLANFPVLIQFTDPDLSVSAQGDGDDIVFTTSDGQTILPYEIESYTSGTGALVAWVKVPSLSSSEDTALWMYYGNPGASSQQDPAGVWDTNYMAVWHLKPDLLDSTSNNNDGVNTGTSDAGGKIDRARYNDNSNNWVQVGSLAAIDDIFGSGGTFSAWINPLSVGENSEGRIGDKASAYAGTNGWAFSTYTGPELSFRKGFGTTAGIWSTPASSITPSAWQYVVVTYNQASAANDPVIYINGVSQSLTETSPAGAVQSDAAQNMRIGNSAAGNARDFFGTIDEVRASKTIRSAEWIATEYNNQNDPSAFHSLGGEEQWWKC